MGTVEVRVMADWRNDAPEPTSTTPWQTARSEWCCRPSTGAFA